MPSPKATLGGLPLLASPEVGWRFTAGVQPTSRRFRMASDAAAALQAQAGTSPVTLRVEIPGDSPLVVKYLYVLSVKPDSNPALSWVEVADGRILWTRAHVVRPGYNVPRSTAINQRLAQEGVPVPVQPTARGLTFATWSLYPRERPRVPWSAKNVLKDVLDDVVKQALGPGTRISGKLERQARVVGTSFDDPGPSAVQRALMLLPGANVIPDNDGVIAVVDELDDSGNPLAATGPEIANRGRVGLLQLDRFRPSSVRVLFDREFEIRFNAAVEGETVSARSRVMLNVAPVPDPSLVVGGVQLGSGSWVPIGDLCAAFPAPTAAGLQRFSTDVVRKGYLAPNFLESYARPPGTHQPDILWANRVATCLAHFRQTFQLAEFWRDRLREINTSRVAVLDPSRLTRGRAQVFTDYAVLPTVLGLMRTSSQGDTAAAWNVFGYTNDIKNARGAAPATVEIVDRDQFIIHVAYALDPTGEVARVAPSLINGPDGTVATIANFDLRKAQGGRGAGLLTAYGTLAERHRLAVVLSALPGAPNDASTCHTEVVSADAAATALGVPVGSCTGPVWTLRVGPSILRALYAWDDRTGDGFDAAFGSDTVPPNLALGPPINGELLAEVAQAAAAALYSGLLDRFEGQHVTTWDPTVVPRGNATQVEHVVPGPGGGVPRTAISFPRYVRGVDVLSILPESVRQRVLGGPTQ